MRPNYFFTLTTNYDFERSVFINVLTMSIQGLNTPLQCCSRYLTDLFDLITNIKNMSNEKLNDYIKLSVDLGYLKRIVDDE